MGQTKTGMVGGYDALADAVTLYNSASMEQHTELWAKIQQWAHDLGFSQIGVAGIDLSDAEEGLMQWLAKGFHGEMAFMQQHGLKRTRPAELVPGTVSIITARMDYLPQDTPPAWQSREWQRQANAHEAVVSVYARGRDYHKVLRNRLQKLAERIQQEVGPLGFRAFTDSAPVMEVELARRSGLGWRGKHTLLLSRKAGSMFFLGEIFLDMALPPTPATTAHCGQCSACMDICPTQAIVAPGQVDARLCISYLTIEHAEAIPEHLRPLIGNHLYGCDDCQLACPWNKFATPAVLADFNARAVWNDTRLLTLLQWQEADFLRYTEGSPIRRIGFARWQRNLAVVCGNALRQLSAEEAVPIRQHLQSMQDSEATPALVREHVLWALAQQRG